MLEQKGVKGLNFPVSLTPVTCQRNPKTFPQSLQGRGGSAFVPPVGVRVGILSMKDSGASQQISKQSA